MAALNCINLKYQINKVAFNEATKHERERGRRKEGEKVREL
jgi:hypothetical protein